MQTAPRTAADSRTPDPDLAALVAGGDEAAFRVLMQRHNQTLYRTARAILRDDTEAEEALQDAWLQAYRAMPGFRGDSKLSTWLVRIAANEALQRRRKVRRTAEVIPMSIDEESGDRPVVDEPRDESPSAAPEIETLRGEMRRLLEARIDRLPDAFREVFVLRAVEEMSVEETATALEIPEATVRTRFFRARSLLRESLAREVDSAMEGTYEFMGARCEAMANAVIARLRRLRGPAPSGSDP
jgi:RNA polymerase sigma-70 factor (ECF subfamily)